MKWILPLVLLFSYRAYAQPTFELNDFVGETSRSMDVFGYTDPEFAWDMEGRVQVELNEGINYLKEEKPNLALPKLEQAIKLDPKLWIAHYYKGICLKMLNRYAHAVYALSIADKLHPNDFVITIELGKANDLLRNFEQGQQYFEAAAKINPASGLPLYLLGNHYYLLRPADGTARKFYEDALRLDPMMLDAEVKLAMLSNLQNNKAETMKYLENVLRKDSLHKQALFFHGSLTVESDKKASIRDWDKLVQMNPFNFRLRIVRGVLRTETGKFDEAFSDLRKAVESMPINDNQFSGNQSINDRLININYASYYVMSHIYGLEDKDAAAVRKAFCLLFVGDNRSALQAINEVSISYDTPLCWFVKGIIYEQGEVHAQAYKSYEIALKMDNDILDAHKKRGIYRMELKQWAHAEKDFNEMLRINPEAIFAYRALGLCSYQQEKYTTAIDYFTKFLNKDDQNKEVKSYRGMAYQKNKQLLNATVDFLEAGTHEGVEPFPVIQAELDKLIAAKDTAMVVDWLTKMTAAEPTFIYAEKYFLDLLMNLKRWEAVDKQADVALLRTPEMKGRQAGPGYTKEDRSHLLSVKGTALVNLNESEEAITELNRAIELNKKNSLAWLSRGKAQIQLKHRSAAVKDLKMAEELGQKEATGVLKSLK